jgi:hypothetical protein
MWNLGDATMPAYQHVEGERVVTVTDSVIDHGIWVASAEGAVSGNTVTNDVGGGLIEISPLGGGATEVAGNTASAIAIVGDADGTGVKIHDDTIRGGAGTGVGITIGRGSPSIEDNDIGDVRVGIVVPVDATPTIRSNVIDSTGTAIVINGSATAPIIEANQLCGDVQAVSVPDGSTFTLDPSNEVCGATT